MAEGSFGMHCAAMCGINKGVIEKGGGGCEGLGVGESGGEGVEGG